MNEKRENFFVEVLKFSIITIIIVLPFRMYIAKPFIVSGASMSPNFETGNYLIIDEISYKLGEPQRGEVIVFKYPNDPSRFFIKRIIGLPNETIKIKDNEVIIKNESYPEGMKLDEVYLKKPTEQNIERTLGNKEYFVMGDNRTNSSDSRFWGPLNKEFIVGRAFVRLLPINKIDLFPADFDY
ncbi:signal peptidase I [Candidatus Campbellbacteria bacterium RIFOXYC2_FULL_35_25]|uniref:Signal peptidase I n=1 Tax=Candidatus Campbellbacteria bacterium RIFOXYC2_FULL_35_25 TaxID=1797582 RepID=A0A1F5EHR1_9BACT|nr:MAG: signal peptidase I [Candidatus Campbellbacteria bacterium RIFOXYC2_FULL_35_25]